MKLAPSDLVWNRAAMEAGGADPCEGDTALSALLLVHGMVMNGGVDHALEATTAGEYSAGILGFRYFGLSDVAAVLDAAKKSPGKDMEELNTAYGRLVPDDSTLFRAFSEKYRASPAAFAPLRATDA